jgi:small GTP-binding protein
MMEVVLGKIAEVREPADPDVTRVAVVGKPNVGKSTLVNAFCGQERVIVSERPGTTRDAIDIDLTVGERKLTIVDTAGLRRRTKVRNSVEFFSQSRARSAIARSNGVVFLLEAVREVSTLEKKIGALIQESGKPCVLGLNKWDLVPEDQRDPQKFFTYMNQAFPVLSFAPVQILSAKTGLEVWETMDTLLGLVATARLRVGTGELNRAISYALQGAPNPIRGTKEAPLRDADRRLAADLHHLREASGGLLGLVRPPRRELPARGPSLRAGPDPDQAARRVEEETLISVPGSSRRPVRRRCRASPVRGRRRGVSSPAAASAPGASR